MNSDVDVDNFFYSYPPVLPEGEPVPVLKGVTFKVRRGESVALLGRVGAGKTTLCMSLNGLVPHATGGVVSGNVEVLGQNTKQTTVANLARQVGMVFQDPETQLVQMRVEDELAFGLENLGVPQAEMEERVTWALDAVGLSEYRDRSPLLLSGGEKQRVALAAVLAMQPRLLVLDEPTASLDPAGKTEVFRVLARLRRERALTIIIATQEMERIARFVDRVLVLHHGAIAEDGPPEEVFQKVPRLQEMGIGVPQAAELADLLAQRTRRRYHFYDNSGAYKNLRQQARKLEMRKLSLPPPVPAQPRPNPFIDRHAVELENVSYIYEDGIPALRSVSLAIPQGEFVALMGPNGAGKTTLARHFNGLIHPTSGRVLVERRNTREMSVAQLARVVGYAFQNPDHQIFAATVQEEIAFGTRMQELPRNIVAQRVAEMLDRFQLAAFAHLPPAVLGYGQRRKVALAAILAMHPRVLILDEPTAGLDWRSRQELMEIVTGFHALGRTVVLITHEMRLVAEFATRAVVLAAGSVVFDGTPRELFNQRDVLKQAQLLAPPVMRLARRLQSEGMEANVLTTSDFVSAWVARVQARRKGKKARQEAGA